MQYNATQMVLLVSEKQSLKISPRVTNAQKKGPIVLPITVCCRTDNYMESIWLQTDTHSKELIGKSTTCKNVNHMGKKTCCVSSTWNATTSATTAIYTLLSQSWQMKRPFCPLCQNSCAGKSALLSSLFFAVFPPLPAKSVILRLRYESHRWWRPICKLWMKFEQNRPRNTRDIRKKLPCNLFLTWLTNPGH